MDQYDEHQFQKFKTAHSMTVLLEMGVLRELSRKRGWKSSLADLAIPSAVIIWIFAATCIVVVIVPGLKHEFVLTSLNGLITVGTGIWLLILLAGVARTLESAFLMRSQARYLAENASHLIMTHLSEDADVHPALLYPEIFQKEDD